MIEDREPTGDTTSAVQEPTAENGAPRKQSKLAVWSYVLYNFGNTPFALTILTLYFPLWLTEEYLAGPALFNYTAAAASLLVVLIAPALGAICDLHQKRLRYVVVLTLITVLFTLGLSGSYDITGSLFVTLFCFVVAAVAYNLINVPYYALLPSVAEGRGTGKISGLTQAAGFIGTLLATLAFVLFITPENFFGFSLGGPEQIKQHYSHLGAWIDTSTASIASNTFLPTAAFFLLFALPAFFLVPDVAVRAPQPARLGEAYRSVLTTLRNIRAYAGLGTYMVVTLLVMDAMFVAVPNMCIFAKSVFGMEDGQISNLIAFSLIFSILAAFGAGRISDKIGPKRTLLATMGVWVVGIMALVFAWAPWVLFVAAPLMFLATGATIALGPVLLIALSPSERLTEFMGFYVTVGQLSAALGPLVLGLLLGMFGGLGTDAYRIAISSLAVAMVVGIFLLLRVPDARTSEEAST
jgi:MFS transporter, UMF1 family